MSAADEAPEILLQHHLKKLKLPTVLREYEKVARQCAAENVDHVRYLARLIELELLDREARMIDRRIKAARFPAIKSLESFDFDAIPALNKKLVLDLARGEFVSRRENVIALGPSGVGKSHVAIALGLAACQHGIKTRFVTASAIVHEMIEARDERRLLRLQKQLATVELLIIDELASGQIEDQLLVEGWDCIEVEALKAFDRREAGRLDAPVDHAGLPVQKLQLDQAGQIPDMVDVLRRALSGDLLVLSEHGRQLQLLEVMLKQDLRRFAGGAHTQVPEVSAI